MKIEDFATLLAKLEFEPRRREKLRRNIPTWRFGFEAISPIAEVSFNARFPRYPARWDGQDNWEGSAVPIELDPDLVLLLDFEEGSGSIAYDRVVKYRNNGIIYGAIWVPGIIGFGLEFTGTDYVEIPAPVGSPLELAEEFTIELWIKGEPRDNYLKVINKGDGFSNNYLFLGTPIYKRALSAGEIANHAACNYFNDIGVWG